MSAAQAAVSAQTVRDQHPDRELLRGAGDFHRMRAEDKAFWKVTKDARRSQQGVLQPPVSRGGLSRS
jgi:hypothetical protein